jgi:hypothetical protein
MKHNSNFNLHTFCFLPFGQQDNFNFTPFGQWNTISTSTYTLSVSRRLTNTTQFQFQLTHSLFLAIWPTRPNFNFNLHTVCFTPFGQHDPISTSIYTLSVSRRLANTTQFQFQLTHCLFLAIWPTRPNFNFNLHTVCFTPFGQHDPISTSTYTLFMTCNFSTNCKHYVRPCTLLFCKCDSARLTANSFYRHSPFFNQNFLY